MQRRRSTAVLLALVIALSHSPTAALADEDTQSIDGTGNNLTHPEWGSTGIQLLRITPSDYGDGISTPAGADRPSARAVSNAVAAQSGEMQNDRDLSDMVWAWGQFIDHDVSLTPNADPKEPFNILVPAGDPFFDPNGDGNKVIRLDRSLYDPATGSGTGKARQQRNVITAFMDASNVYGSDPARATALRTFSGGLLKTSDGNLLPLNTEGLPNAPAPIPSFFLAGDVRANEAPTLTALHTLFVREHNRKAKEIAEAEAGLSDEELYQRARRHVIALLQAMTFEEFLPALFGKAAVVPYVRYDERVNPGIANVFSTAAYRFGHTMISPGLLLQAEDGTPLPGSPLALREAFFNPDIIKGNGIDPVLRGITSHRMQELDTRVIDELRNFLFGPPGSGGLDLASLNMQRGRDHGLPSYNEARRALGMAPKTSFMELTSDPKLAAAFEEVYGDIEKVDVWIGGLAEDHLPGTSVGQLFTHIIVDQFLRIRNGDRFWYENILDPVGALAYKQTTLADVIRRNTSVRAIPENVFFVPETPPALPDLGITLQLPSEPAEQGQPLDVALTASNDGNVDMEDVTITLTYPHDLTFQTEGSAPACASKDSTVQCTGLNLAGGKNEELTVQFTTTNADCNESMSFSASITLPENDPLPDNNESGVKSMLLTCPGGGDDSGDDGGNGGDDGSDGGDDGGGEDGGDDDGDGPQLPIDLPDVDKIIDDVRNRIDRHRPSSSHRGAGANEAIAAMQFMMRGIDPAISARHGARFSGHFALAGNELKGLNALLAFGHSAFAPDMSESNYAVLCRMRDFLRQEVREGERSDRLAQWLQHELTNVLHADAATVAHALTTDDMCPEKTPWDPKLPRF